MKKEELFEFIQALGNNHELSATQLLDLLLDKLLDYITSADEVKHLKFDLISALTELHPEMTVFSNLINYMQSIPEPWTTTKLKNLLEEFKHRLALQEEAVVSQFIEECKKTNLRNFATLSYSKMVYLALSKLYNLKMLDTVTIGISPPKFEGITLANDLKTRFSDLSITLMEDSMLSGEIIQFSDIDAVVLGCDAIYDDCVINKTGSLNLALVCSHYNKPLFVLGSELKLRNGNCKPSTIRDHEATDLYWYKKYTIHAGIQIKNRFFDIVPKDLITLLL